MADTPPNAPTGPSGPDDGGRLLRAKEIFLAVAGMGIRERDEAIATLCGDDPALRELVRGLVRAQEAPLPFEALADDIRAAHPALDTSGATGVSGPTASAPASSDRIGNYRLLERIGEGGFGIVYMAEQERPVRRRVALKIIKLGMDTRQVVARFEAERQALALMDHPGIAKVFDAGATPTGRPYFVMELVRGLPITEYCDSRTLSIRDRLALVAQVCDALQHAHSKGVIHRDIKPSNVLVSTVGDTPAPKIIDFGIAKATSARLTEKTIFTEFRQMIGTPEYMSPEQAGESGEDVDTRTDVYSVGVLLYELLTGATPFDSKRLRSAAFGEMQRIIREEDPPAPSTRITIDNATLGPLAEKRATAPARLRTVIRGELDWIVMRALEKDRSRRYATAEAMREDLNRYLSGRAIEAAPPSTAYRIRKFVRRHKGAVIAAALITLALIVGLVGTTMGFFRAEAQRKIAVSQRERADEKTREAEAAEAVATRGAYTANVMSASAAINAVQYFTARSFLDAAPQRLRGWEWRILNARLDSSIGAVQIPALADTRVDHMEAHPDGRSFFTVSVASNPLVHRWDIDTGGLLQSFPPPYQHSSSDWSRAAISSDGNWLTTAPIGGEVDATVPVDRWNLATGERERHTELPWQSGLAFRTVMTSDGTRVAALSADHAWLLDPIAGVTVAQAPLSDPCVPLAFSPDGTMIAEYNDRNPDLNLTIRNGQTLARIAHIRGHDSMISRAEFSADNKWLGTVSHDGAKVWDVSEALTARPFVPGAQVFPHPFSVTELRFSPDASRIATLSIDRAIRIWDRATGALQATYASESLTMRTLMFLPDGRRVAGLESGGTVRFWDISAEGTVVLRGHESIVAGARFAPSNPAGIIVSASWEGINNSTGIVRVWDADSGDQVGVYRGVISDLADTLAVSRDGTLAAVGISNARLFEAAGSTDAAPYGRNEVIDLITGALVYSAPTLSNQDWIAFGPDDRSVIVAGHATSQPPRVRLEVLDPVSGAVVRSRELDAESDWSFGSSADGTLIAAIPRIGPGLKSPAHPDTALVLDATTLETIRQLTGLPPQQRVIAFDSTGTRIALGGIDGGLRVFDASTGAPIGTAQDRGMEIFAIAFSPDGARFASAGRDQLIHIWDARTFEQVAAFAGHEGHIADIQWDNAGQRMVSSSGDRTVRIWEPEPIRTRVEARDSRSAALSTVAPLIARWFDELHDPHRVIERITGDATLTPTQHKIALQEVLRIGLERGAPPAPAP